MNPSRTRRRLLVATGSRAEYGLLRPLVEKLQGDPAFNIGLLVTGAHLSRRHGFTVREIVADGFPIVARVPILSGGDSPLSMANHLSRTVFGSARALAHIQPDLLLVLGDRWEMLGVCSSALMLGIPIAHIHGGESTEGLIDEAIRHAITKMAHLHFTAAEPYRRRVIQLGESPKRVFQVGGLGVDAALAIPALSRTEIEKRLGMKIRPETFLITYHPETLRPGNALRDMRALLQALKERKEAAFIFTLPGAEAESGEVAKVILDFTAKHRDRAVARPSLGSRLYLSLMRSATAVVGNSSSGLLEAPSFGIPTLNIGDRQKGRLRASSVVDCQPDTPSLRRGLRKILSRKFRETARKTKNPYGSGGASGKIVKILRKQDLKNLLLKKFHDL